MSRAALLFVASATGLREAAVVMRSTRRLRGPPVLRDSASCFVTEDMPPGNAVLDVDVAPFLLPLVLPAAAFFGYEDFMAVTTWCVDNLTPGNWDAVDGGHQQVEMLQPTVNGIVLPALSFALGTLSAASVSTLRQRQVSQRTCLNKESCLLDMLHSAIATVFDGAHRRDELQQAVRLLREYASRLIAESRRGVDLEQLQRQGAADSELRSLYRILHSSPAIREGVFHEAGLAGHVPSDAAPSPSAAPHTPEARAVEEPRFFVTTEFNTQALVKELLLLRSERLALLLTTFPLTHWLTQALLGGSILLAFLVESDDQALLFLDQLQLRLMFTILVGALTGIGVILYDLNDPFQGTFQITPAASQLYVIRDILDEEMAQRVGHEGVERPLMSGQS